MRRISPQSFERLDNKLALAELHRRIGCTFQGQVFNHLIAHPELLQAFVAAIQPLYNSRYIHGCAAELMRSVDTSNNPETATDYLSWLVSNGGSREDIRQIQYVVETFYNLEPVFAVLTATCGEWLSCESWEECVPVPDCEPIYSGLPGHIELVSTSDIPVRFLQAYTPDGHIHVLHRALAVWPWFALKLADDCGIETRQSLDRTASALWSRAVRLGASCASRMPAPPRQEATCRLLSDLDDCLWSSCDAIALAAMLRDCFVSSWRKTAGRIRQSL